jgi:hypothetical protein
MKKFNLIFAILVMISFTGLSFGKMPYKAGVGLTCKACHTDDNKAKNPSNPLWQKAKDHQTNLSQQNGKFAGKKTCFDCHEGKQKPIK